MLKLKLKSKRPKVRPESGRPVATEAKGLASPLKYHGGKSYLASWIVSHMPPHLHYVEPFFGGGSVLFAKPFDRISEVVNDLDGQLTNFFAVLSNSRLFEKFARRVALQPFSQPLWEQNRQLLASGEGSQVQRAVAYFVFNRQSRAGQMRDFASLTRNRLRRGMNEQASAWLSAVDGLPEVHARLQQVVVLNKPAIDVIREQDGSSTFFYCDPPYVPATRSAKQVYRHEMSITDHKQLLNVLRSCKGKVMLSGYDNSLYERKLSAWRKVVREMPNHAAAGKSKRRMQESLWMNY